MKEKIIAVLLVLVGILGGSQVGNLGSVAQSHEYQATTTSSAWANTPRLIFSGSGTLGSVVIGTTHASIVELRDATSSTDIASTSIATLAASPANGSTMTFDVSVKRGLMVNTPVGFSGIYTITSRP